MATGVRANSPKHKILEALTSTNKTAAELFKITGQTHGDCLACIEDLMQSGFVNRMGNGFTITMFGMDIYSQLGRVRIAQKRVGQKAGTRNYIPQGELKDHYNLDLNRITCREGALDFLKHPSVYAGRQKERK